MNSESAAYEEEYSSEGDEEQKDSYIDFENENLPKEIMNNMNKKQSQYELPDYMKELQAPIENQVFDQSFHKQIKNDDMQFFEDDLDSDRLYEMGTDRKLVASETELKDMKITSMGKQNTKSTYGSSDGIIRKNQFLEDQNDNSWIVGEQDSSFTQKSFNKSNYSSFDFNLELKRLQEISKIEKKLQKSGTKPIELLNFRNKRTFLDRISVPRKIRVKCPCCKIKWSYMFCLFCIVVIDFCILVKYFIQISEMHFYAADYPKVVQTEVILKTIICWLMITVEGVLVFRMRIFKACKLAYAFKLLKIVFIFYQAFIKDEILQEQCANWLKNPEHHFQRNSDDVNTHRPLTMVFNCNFERVYEEKERKETENTIHYYKFNHFMQSMLISIELVYCLICMAIFLLIIYWSHEGNTKVILGQDEQYLSDDGDDDITYEEKLDRLHFLKERERQAQILDRHLSNFSGGNSFSSVDNGSINDSRNYKSQTYLSNYQLNSLRKNQNVMKIDSIYHGPTQSGFVRSVNGSVQRDKRMKMNNSLMNVNSKLENFGNLKSNRKKPVGMNTSRSKVSVSNARINMRQYKPQVEQEPVLMSDEAFAKENDEYFKTGIYNKNNRNYF